MSILYAIILGVIQGITEYLPVSSFGHSMVLRTYLGYSDEFAILFSVFLHIGTLLGIWFVFHKDIRQIIREIPGIFGDLLANFNIYLKNRRSESKKSYRRIVRSNSRKISVMVLVGTIPTALLGYAARGLAQLWSQSAVMTAIGFLLTGIVLLVVDFSKPRGKHQIRTSTFDHAMWMGICQGISVFPGISRCALTVSAGLLCGETILFAVKLSYLFSIPAVAGGLLCEIGNFALETMNSETILMCIFGMLAAAVTGTFTVTFCIKKLRKIRFRYFAFYCFFIGILTLIFQFS
jgi:undecaprenyl-diphosphatase